MQEMIEERKKKLQSYLEYKKILRHYKATYKEEFVDSNRYYTMGSYDSRINITKRKYKDTPDLNIYRALSTFVIAFLGFATGKAIAYSYENRALKNELINEAYANGTFDELLQLTNSSNRSELEYFISETEFAFRGDSAVIDPALVQIHYDYEQILNEISGQVVDAVTYFDGAFALGVLGCAAISAGIIGKYRFNFNNISSGAAIRKEIADYTNKYPADTKAQEKRNDRLNQISATIFWDDYSVRRNNSRER